MLRVASSWLGRVGRLRGTSAPTLAGVASERQGRLTPSRGRDRIRLDSWPPRPAPRCTPRSVISSGSGIRFARREWPSWPARASRRRCRRRAGWACWRRRMARPAELRAEIRRVREQTDRPFGVDILFATTRTTGDGDRPLHRRREEDGSRSRSRSGCPSSSRGSANPGPVTAPGARDPGSKVMALCGNVKQARDHAASGVDVVIAQGHEAGGHTGTHRRSRARCPAVPRAVAPVPVLTAPAASRTAAGSWPRWRSARRDLDRHALHRDGPEAFGRDNYKETRSSRSTRKAPWSRARPRASPIAGVIRNSLHARVGEAAGRDPAVPGEFERVGKPARRAGARAG